MALLGLLAVWRGQSLDAPFCSEGDVLILQLPYMGGEGSAVGVGLFVEGVAVGVVPLLEGVGCQADVFFVLLLRGNCTLVDHIWSQAASLQNTAGLAVPTVATTLHMFLYCACDSPVVAGDDAGHVGHTGVAYFYSLSVEVLVEGRLLVKVLVYQL